MANISPARWTRDTPWRQGALLTIQAASELHLLDPDAPESTFVCIISHDCDLANDDLDEEPDVEVILGRMVAPKPDGYSWGKSIRTLHLQAMRNNTPFGLELRARNKRLVPKAALAAFVPDPEVVFNNQDIDTLRRWLAARYYRSAFPDDFNDFFSKSTNAAEKLEKAVRKFGGVTAVYFDLGGARVAPYPLTITLAFDAGDDAEEASEAAEGVANKVTSIMETCLTSGGPIQFKACKAASEDDITVAQSRRLQQWRLDYVTAKASDGQLAPPSP
jgi:hypothetical protein